MPKKKKFKKAKEVKAISRSHGQPPKTKVIPNKKKEPEITRPCEDDGSAEFANPDWLNEDLFGVEYP